MQSSIRVTSFIYLQLSAEGQESVSRRSVSKSDEIETFIDLEERWHIPSTTEVHNRRRSEVFLLNAPSNSSTEMASISDRSSDCYGCLFLFYLYWFLPNPTEMTFTKTSIRDHKHAKEKGKGFH